MPSWRKAVSGTLLLGLILGAGCRKPAPSANGQAPSFVLKDLSGKTVRLEDFRGHPVLLDFWATWCGPCMLSTPIIQKLYDRYRAQGFVVLGLNMDDDPSPVYAFVKRFGVTYPILYAANSPVASQYGLEGLPLFVLLDQQGKIVNHYSGFSFEVLSSLDEELQMLLPPAPPAPATPKRKKV